MPKSLPCSTCNPQFSQLQLGTCAGTGIPFGIREWGFCLSVGREEVTIPSAAPSSPFLEPGQAHTAAAPTDLPPQERFLRGVNSAARAPTLGSCPPRDHHAFPEVPQHQGLFGVWGLVYNTPPKHSVWWMLTALAGDPLPPCPAREGPALSPQQLLYRLFSDSIAR